VVLRVVLGEERVAEREDEHPADERRRRAVAPDDGRGRAERSEIIDVIDDERPSGLGPGVARALR
jgi:hypothetical protein